MEPTVDQSLGRDQNWNIWDVLLISLGTLALFGAGFLLLRLLPLARQAETGISIWMAVIAAALEAVALIGSLFLLGLRRRRWGWERLGLRSFAPVWLLVAFGVGIVITPLAGIIALVIRRLLNLPLESPQLSFLLPEDINLLGGLAMIVLAGLVVPLAEELFFRGLLYTWLRGRWGFAPAAFASALIFGVVHLEPSVAGTAFILGLILAWLYERSGSLWTAVLVHAMNNSIQILLLYALIALGFPMNGI